MAPKHEISLLPKEEFEQRAMGRFLIWALSVGRWIVVFTEFIVICAFLSRFYLDRRIADLHDDIFQKQAIVRAMSGFEEEFRFLQQRLETVDQLVSQATPNEVLEAVISIVPNDVSLTDFSFKEGRIEISGITLSHQGLSSFGYNLDKLEGFDEVKITQVSKDEKKARIDFSISAKFLKKQENAVEF